MSSDFPVTVFGYQSDHIADPIFGDGILVRFDLNDIPVCGTYFSGNYSEDIRSLMIVSDGIITVWETESTDLGQFYPNAPPPEETTHNVMIVKYSLDLSEVIWARSIAGNHWDYFEDMALAGDNLICVGESYSTNIPGANPNPSSFGSGYVLLLDAADGEITGFRFLYPGSIHDVVGFPDGGFALSGHHWTDERPQPTAGAADTSYAGASEAYLAKYDANVALEWLTYLGGNGDDYHPTLAWHESSRSYVTSWQTTSGDLPVVSTFWNNTRGERYDIYICALDEHGREIRWGGYLGGSGDENASFTVLDDDDNLVVGIGTKSIDLPLVEGHLEPVPDESLTTSGYLARIPLATRTLAIATYLPGNGYHWMQDIELLDGEIITVGSNREGYSDGILIPTPDALDPVSAGYSDGTVLRIRDEGIVGIEPHTTTPPPPSLAHDLTITSDAANLYLASAAFSVPLARVDVYDLKGRRLLTRRSLLADTDHGPAHVLPREALGRIAGGTYVVAVTCEDRRVSAAVSLRE